MSLTKKKLKKEQKQNKSHQTKNTTKTRLQISLSSFLMSAAVVQPKSLL